MLMLLAALVGLHAGTPGGALGVRASRPSLAVSEHRALELVPAAYAPDVFGGALARGPEWLDDGKRAVALFPSLRPEEWLTARLALDEASDVAKAARWVAALPVRIDVRNSGVHVALSFRAP